MHRYRFLGSPVHYPWPANGHFPPRRRETFAVCEGENIKPPDTLKIQRLARAAVSLEIRGRPIAGNLLGQSPERT